MTNELLTALRYKSEGTDIDFKSAQYRFIGGSEDDKAEMLKDILAMANAWRDGPGYILLGFKDQRPHPAEVVGISQSIDDAKVQQFVHGKVKPKLTFHYEEHLYEGKTIGVLSIPKQKRPFYLSNAYGKLKSNVVYVRRGSSTDEAEPPEISAMAMADSGRGDMRVDLSVLTPENGNLPDTFAHRYLQFTEKFPDYESPRQTIGPFGIDIRPLGLQDNRHFWKEYAEYLRVDEGLILMQFVLLNRSEVQLSNAPNSKLLSSHSLGKGSRCSQEITCLMSQDVNGTSSMAYTACPKLWPAKIRGSLSMRRVQPRSATYALAPCCPARKGGPPTRSQSSL